MSLLQKSPIKENIFCKRDLTYGICQPHVCDLQPHMCVHRSCVSVDYGVARIVRLFQIIGLFCKRALSKRLYSAKETCDFKEPTIRSHPTIHIPMCA